MATDETEPRIAVFLDYENLAIGSRDNLGADFNFGPAADALAEARNIKITGKSDGQMVTAPTKRRDDHHVEKPSVHISVTCPKTTLRKVSISVRSPLPERLERTGMVTVASTSTP